MAEDKEVTGQAVAADGGDAAAAAAAGDIKPLEKKIIRQMEYYFGDHNLPLDKFLQESIKSSEEGWVSMETMLKFNRLSQLSTDSDVILAAIKKSKSGLLETAGQGGESKVRRNPALPIPENTEETVAQKQARTAYAKGFDKENTTLDELLEYFHDADPSVVNVRLRTYVDNKDKEKGNQFKGSIFITFKDEASCKKFVESGEYKYKGVDILRRPQKDYLEEKEKEYLEKKSKKGGRKDRNQKNGEDKNSQGENGKEEESKGLPTGTVLKMEGLGGDITREDIKEFLEAEYQVNIAKEGGDIGFITYEKGNTDAKVRFKVENYAKTLMEKWAEKEKHVIKDMEVKGSLLEGEEETKFLADSLQDLKNQRNRNKGHKRKSYGKGGPGGKRQRN